MGHYHFYHCRECQTCLLVADVCIELKPFIILLVTLTLYQGRSSINRLQQKQSNLNGGGDSLASVEKLPLPSYLKEFSHKDNEVVLYCIVPPGILVPVFITKVAQDVKLIYVRLYLCFLHELFSN